jgi:hypothetical protein
VEVRSSLWDIRPRFGIVGCLGVRRGESIYRERAIPGIYYTLDSRIIPGIYLSINQSIYLSTHDLPFPSTTGRARPFPRMIPRRSPTIHGGICIYRTVLRTKNALVDLRSSSVSYVTGLNRSTTSIIDINRASASPGNFPHSTFLSAQATGRSMVRICDSDLWFRWRINNPSTVIVPVYHPPSTEFPSKIRGVLPVG